MLVYLKNILIAIDQLFNTVLLGWPDETFSSRCWRWYLSGIKIPCYIVDTLLFFDKNHCKSSYESEVLRRQAPPETREIN